MDDEPSTSRSGGNVPGEDYGTQREENDAPEYEDSTAGQGSQEKPKKPKRKRTSVRKSFTRRKQKGRYTPKTLSEDSKTPSEDSKTLSEDSKTLSEDADPHESNLPIIGVGDLDLAECLLSDEEERAEFLHDIHSVPEHVDAQSRSECPGSGSSHEPVSDYLPESFDSMYSPSSDGCPPDLSEEYIGAQTASENVLPEAQHAMSPPAYFAMLSSLPELLDSPSHGDDTCNEPTESALSEEIISNPGVQGSDVTPFDISPEVVEAALMPSSWTPIADKWGFHLLQICCKPVKSVQKQVSMSFNKSETILVHCTTLPFASKLLQGVTPQPVEFGESTLDSFVQRGCNIVQKLYQYDVCVGADDQDRKKLWDNVPDSYVDLNAFGEDKYDETCRSTSCHRLILLGVGKRCSSCSKLQNILRKRQLPPDSLHPFTNNRYLTPEQAKQKLKFQTEEMRRKDKQIAYLKKRIAQIIEDEGVDIDVNLSDDLSTILASADISEVQKVFLQEQLKYAAKSDKRGMRWHPTMIRLALSIRMTSSSAYEALRDSGAINLPSSRTLYDYSRPFPPQSGVSEGLLKMTAEKVSKLPNYRKYVTLIADEVYVSRNLVYRQSDGLLQGYVHLEEVEKELLRFENCLNGNEPTTTSHLANKILAFMVKGILSGVKCVIAAYPCNQLSKEMLYARMWHVISRLERAGIRVLVIVSDGCSVSRAFICMHKPLSKTTSGIIFDTLNMCSPDRRPLVFMSDVAHLLKTIRNCFYNSGEGPKKTRCMELDGEKIVWAIIVRLYLHYKQFNLRKSYKLSALNVFPNSYSCMKVHLAAEVISETVAADIEQQGWPKTTQTVNFIRTHNKLFDVLNGAHSSEHIRTRNSDLAPYTNAEDPRFKWLTDTYLKGYLEYWRNQVKAQGLSLKDQNRKMLSAQTQEGIEIAIKGFIGACKYLLNEAEKNSKKIFIMARAFSQDDLEHHFSRQRAAGGGNRNMNTAQFLGNQVSIGIVRDVGFKRKGSNVQGQGRLEVTDERLGKRRRTR